jgi:hypothetical protein
MMPYRSLRCSIARHGQPRTDTLAIAALRARSLGVQATENDLLKARLLRRLDERPPWLEKGLAIHARWLRLSPRSLCERALCEARLPRWRRRPAQPHPRPAHPIGIRVPQSVRRRWTASALA